MTDYEVRPDPAQHLLRFLCGFALGAAIGMAPFAFFPEAPWSLILSVGSLVGVVLGIFNCRSARVRAWLKGPRWLSKYLDELPPRWW